MLRAPIEDRLLGGYWLRLYLEYMAGDARFTPVSKLPLFLMRVRWKRSVMILSTSA